jgi:hypothetical protein
MNKINSLQTPKEGIKLIKLLANVASNLNFSYEILFNPQLIPNRNILTSLYLNLTIDIAEGSKLSQYHNLPFGKERQFRLLGIRSFDQIIANKASTEFIIQINEGKSLISFINSLDWNIHGKVLLELLLYLVNTENNKLSENQFFNIIQKMLVWQKGKIVDFLLNNFLQLNGQKINPSKILTHLITSELPDNDYINAIIYMTSRNIRPIFEDMLPTYNLLQRLPEADDDDDYTDEMDKLLNRYRSYVTEHIIYILNLLAFSRIVPDPAILNQIPSFSEDDENELHKFIQNIRNTIIRNN